MRVFLPVLLVCFFLSGVLQAQTVGIKVDSVTINTSLGLSGGWEPVVFATPFGSVPVVIVSPTSSNTDPATVRIRNVTTDGFEALVVEATGSDGQTSAMTVDYFAAESGTYTFPGSHRLVVGTVSTATQQGRNVSPTSWDGVTFGTTFSNPAVLTQIQTVNSQTALAPGNLASPWLEVTVDNVTGSDMDIALERAETSTGVTVAETIGYVVMESGVELSLGGETFQALRTPTNIAGWDNGCYSNSFASSFGATPLVIVSQDSRNGADGGWARRCSLNASQVGITIDEDVALDDRSHTTESAGVLAISAAFFGTRNGRDIAAGQFTIQAGASTTQWTSVVFANPFDVAPLVFSLNRSDETAPSQIRLRNISKTGFDMALVKPSGELGAAVETTVDYVAAIPGTFVMPNGDKFEIGSIQTAQTQGLLGGTGWQTLVFASAFTNAPALITQVQTVVNEPALDPSSVSVPWLAVAADNLTNTSVRLSLETAQTQSGSVALPETIAYFAATNGANGAIATSATPIDYEMLLSADNIFGWNNGCYTTNFADTYSNPMLVASQVTRDGSDGGWLRRCALLNNSVGLTVDEDRDRDGERSHTSERAGIFVFDGPFEADILLVDHYAISHSGSAVTCEAELITINAHDFYHVEDADFSATIRVTATSMTAGWSSADVSWELASGLNALGTTGPASVEYTFASGESEVQLWLFNRSAAVIDIDVVDINDSNITDPDDGGSEDLPLTFSDSGFRFYADANNDGNSDGTPIQSPITAGAVSGQMILRAVQTDTETGACLARISGSQTVAMAYECVDPNSCVRVQDARINGVAIDENPAAAVVNYQDVTLTFDSDGEAPFTLQYFDVGDIRLHAAHTLAATVASPEFSLVGSSDLTTVKPADLVITDITAPDASVNPATTTTGNGFVPAASPFRVTVEARGASGLLTPNFGREIAPENLQLMVNGVVMPSGGDVSTLSAASAFIATATAGIFRNETVTWNNVGTITLRAEIDDGDYLAAGNVVGTVSGNVGRFYPAEFSLVSSSVDNGCGTGGFTYMSDLAASYQPIDINYSLQALTSAGLAASNYQANYPVAAINVVAENNNDGIDLSSRMNVSAALWRAGEMNLVGIDTGSFARLAGGSGEVIDGPFGNVQLALRRSSTSVDDTNFPSAIRNVNPATTGDCVAVNECDSVSLSGNLNLVFGRLRSQQAFGPESASLSVLLQSEWWNGSDFELNSGDNCTILGAEDIYFAGNNLLVDSHRTVAIGGGASEGNFAWYVAGDGITLVNGDAGLFFSAPGVGNTGAFNLDVDLTNYPWLRSDWNQDDNNADDLALPSAEIVFGSYRGHDRIIFWQEILTN